MKKKRNRNINSTFRWLKKGTNISDGLIAPYPSGGNSSPPVVLPITSSSPGRAVAFFLQTKRGYLREFYLCKLAMGVLFSAPIKIWKESHPIKAFFFNVYLPSEWVRFWGHEFEKFECEWNCRTSSIRTKIGFFSQKNWIWNFLLN